MGERRSQRRARLAAEELERLGVEVDDKRTSVSQHAGDAVRSGDPALARVLDAALRHRGRIARVTHGFHTWPAGLHPDAARDLLTLGEGPVLDPFCGGGTVLVEALLAGRDTLGLDVAPVACLVARARTTLTTESERTALRSLARRAAEAAIHRREPPPLPDPIPRWYEAHVAAELAGIADVIGKDAGARAVLSAILVKVSLRESDTSAARVEAERPPGTTATLFHRKAREYARMLEELSAAIPAGTTPRARVHREDARELREDPVFGMVVTSPPYPGVYDYVQMQDLREAWLGLTGDPRQEIGSRRQFRADRGLATAAWKADTVRWVRATSRALRPGGRMVVVIGDGQVGGRRVDAYAAMDEAATAAGLRRLARVTVERWDAGVHAMRPEHAILWEKPASGGE